MYAICTYALEYIWDHKKAISNLKKHGVDFADAVGVLEDEFVLWMEDESGHGEQRFVAVGRDFLGRVLTVVFTYRGADIRLISARKATKQEQAYYEEGSERI